MVPVTYKVLWVDDDGTIVTSTKLDAEDYNLKLDHFTNWEDAETSLRKNFDEYSAIILDANCKIRKNSLEQEEFITAVLPSLFRLFGEKSRSIPWFLLSAGTMATFNSIITGAKYQHSMYEEEWGNMLYLKDAPDDNEQNSSYLFRNIQKIAKDHSFNVVLFRHKDVFSYMGKGKLIDSRARKLMLRMLSALYYPEENIKYEYEGNPLRKIIEYVFRAARKQGLLTARVFDNLDHIILLDASRYMAGLNIIIHEDKTAMGRARWGNPGSEKDGANGDAVFPSDVALIVKNTINYSSSNSHTEEDEPFFIDESNKEVFFSYVMQVCYLIKWFGKYVDLHSDVEKNKSMQKEMPPKSKDKSMDKLKSEMSETKVDKVILPKGEIIGKMFLISTDNGVPVCGNYKLSEELRNHKGAVKILKLIDNQESDKDKYPYIITEIK